MQYVEVINSTQVTLMDIDTTAGTSKSRNPGPVNTILNITSGNKIICIPGRTFVSLIPLLPSLDFIIDLSILYPSFLNSTGLILKAIKTATKSVAKVAGTAKDGKNVFVRNSADTKAIEVNTKKAKLNKLSLFKRLVKNPAGAFVEEDVVVNNGAVSLPEILVTCLSSLLKSLILLPINIVCCLSTNILQEKSYRHKEIMGFTAVFLAIFISFNTAYASNYCLSQNYDKQYAKMLMAKAEEACSLPKGIFTSIANVESGERICALNVEGKALFFDSYTNARKALKQKLSKVVTNIDIGIMQLNYKWHGRAFGSAEDMLDPKQNIFYAAKFLKKLRVQHGIWYQAIKFYHSRQEKHNAAYHNRVFAAWYGNGNK